MSAVAVLLDAARSVGVEGLPVDLARWAMELPAPLDALGDQAFAECVVEQPPWVRRMTWAGSWSVVRSRSSWMQIAVARRPGSVVRSRAGLQTASASARRSAPGKLVAAHQRVVRRSSSRTWSKTRARAIRSVRAVFGEESRW